MTEMDYTIAYRGNRMLPLPGEASHVRVTKTLLLVLAVVPLVCYGAAPALVLVKSAVPVLDGLDKQAMLLLNFKGAPAMDYFWYSYSQTSTWLPLMLLAAVSMVWLHPGSWRDKLLFVLSLAAVIVLADQLASGVIKPLAGRLRPSHDPSVCQLLHYVNGYRGGAHGFVSSHAAVNTAITTVLCTVFRNKLARATFVTYDVLMCYSRVYLGVHYPGDVVCGALLGWTLAYWAVCRNGRRIRAFTTGRPPVAILMLWGATVLYLL